jgi:hypothetical protein
MLQDRIEAKNVDSLAAKTAARASIRQGSIHGGGGILHTHNKQRKIVQKSDRWIDRCRCVAFFLPSALTERGFRVCGEERFLGFVEKKGF